MLRWQVVLRLAAGCVAFSGPPISALGAMGLPVVSPIEDSITRGSLSGGTPSAAPASPVAPEPRLLPGNPLWTVPLTSLSASRDRPLFSPSRRPPPPVVVAAPRAPLGSPPPPKPEEPDHPLLTLTGTISGDGGDIGIFFDPAMNNIIRLRIGQSHSGWVLSSIRRREASFEKEQQTATLALPSRGAAQSAQPAAPMSAIAQSGGTWTGVDGRQIASPPRRTLRGSTVLDLPSRNAAQSGQRLVFARARVGATWTDGDGQQIAPPPGTESQSVAASPGAPLVSASAMGPAGTTWTDGDGQLITPPSAIASQSMVASPGPTLVSTSAADQAGATWTDGDGQHIAPPRGLSRSTAASPLIESTLGQNVN
jgi:general secretion pathway protein N